MNLRVALSLSAAMAISLATQVQADAFKPSKADQLKLGKAAAADLRKHEKVLPTSDERVEMLRRVGSRMLSVIDGKKEPWEYSFDVLENKEINAFALPGGPVFFYTGLLSLMDTEDQVAAVIGHELTHVRREHWAYAYASEQKRQLGLSVLLIFTHASRTVADLASVGNDVVLGLPFSRKHESEADQGGLVWMIQAGYNPHGMVEMLQKLRDSTKGGKPPEIFSTHPDDKNRINRVQSEIDKLHQNFPPERPLPWPTEKYKVKEEPKKKGKGG